MRLKTAVLTAVLAGSLAGPSVVEASAANRSHAKRSHAVTATRAAKSSPADASDPGPDPVGVAESIISEIEFDLSAGNIQAILADLPGFGPY